jgi:uroporphyrinogen decarboxylase
MSQPLLLKHISGENIGRFPVWMMRQAGRYLPSYQAIRKENTFWQMATTPELAAKVSLLPLEVLPVDAVIFFSDILTLPYSLGLPITMKESVGPVNEKPLRSVSDFEIFETYDSEKHTPYIAEAQKRIASQLPEEIALLGFAGAPWTVASYLIEGKASRHFENTKRWMFTDPEGLSRALLSLSKATVSYLIQQRQSGAHMVQLFDTWLGEMPKWFFVSYYRPILDEVFSALRAKGIPTIYFTKNSRHVLEAMAGLPADGLSVDSLLSLTEVETLTAKGYFLQGNLDPTLLLKADEGTVRRETRELVKEAQKLSRPAILNLGHGILPGTPVENAKAFIEEARALWV